MAMGQPDRMTEVDGILKSAAEAGIQLNASQYSKQPLSAMNSKIRPIQQTLGIIKPDAMEKAEEIINVIKREGLAILQTRKVKLSGEQAASFYQDAYQFDWFAGSVANLSSGPLLALVLSGPEAIHHWMELVGPSEWKERKDKPTSLRFRYGKKGNDFDNALHAPSNNQDAIRDLHFFFPELIMEPIMTGDGISSDYLNHNVHPVLTIGLSKLVREKPEDPVMWLADWLLANNPNKPKELNNSAAGSCN